MEKALNEIVYKIKKYSIDKKLKNMTDINNLQNLMIEKNKLQNREKNAYFSKRWLEYKRSHYMM